MVEAGKDADTGAPAQLHPQYEVMLRVRASATELPPLRVVAADLAARADFDLDTVADLRLAVDEAAAELLAVAAPGALLTCVFCIDNSQMATTVSVPARPGATLRQDSFGWRVLTTLVDEVRMIDSEQDGVPVLGLELCKCRSVEAPTEAR